MAVKRLLIVDDEKRFAAFVGRVGARLGFDVEVTCHPRDFQKAYTRQTPDVIVMDMVMPEIDGNELVLWLVDRNCTADLIIITGYTPDYASNAKILARFKGLRSVQTLTKPVSVADLRAALVPSPQTGAAPPPQPTGDDG